MKTFLKINILSVLYAMGLFIPIEFLLNVYRINRLTNMDINNILTINVIVFVLSFGAIWYGTFKIYKVYRTKKKMENVIYIYWFLYFFIFTYIRNLFFPFTNEGDIPDPFLGWLLILSVLTYPFYIMICQFSFKVIFEKNNSRWKRIHMIT